MIKLSWSASSYLEVFGKLGLAFAVLIFFSWVVYEKKNGKKAWRTINFEENFVFWRKCLSFLRNIGRNSQLWGKIMSFFNNLKGFLWIENVVLFISIYLWNFYFLWVPKTWVFAIFWLSFRKNLSEFWPILSFGMA